MNPNHHPSPTTRTRPPGVPSRRVVGALVAGALALGLIAGACIAPAPPSSLASQDSSIVTRLLALLAAQDSSRPAATPLPTPAPIASPPALAGVPTTAKPAAAPTAASTESPAAPSEGSSTESSTSTSSEKSAGEKKPVRLPPISHVWLVVLGGSDLTAAATTPAAYPYMTGTLLKQATLLERYSAIEAYELAGDAALLTGSVGESVSTITQPAGEPAETADAFLQRAVAPILASSAYKERGLIVVTFGSVAQEQGLSLTTLGATPPAGALLLSPVLKTAAHNSEAFDSLAPRQSLEAIFAAT